MGLSGLSRAIMAIAVVAFVILVGLSLWRAVAFRNSLMDDLHDPSRAFGFFTGVAATNVVAICLIAIGIHAGGLVCLLRRPWGG